jgi:hypothetical protein
MLIVVGVGVIDKVLGINKPYSKYSKINPHIIRHSPTYNPTFKTISVKMKPTIHSTSMFMKQNHSKMTN